MCGANDNGVVPIAAADDLFTFTHLPLADALTREHGRPVYITAGASVTAVLTARGSVIAWGYLRVGHSNHHRLIHLQDTNGTMNGDAKFRQLQRGPSVVFAHSYDERCVRVACGDNHIVALTSKHKVLAFGDGQQGQLGRVSLQREARQSESFPIDSVDRVADRFADTRAYVPALVTFDDVWTGAFWTIGQVRNHPTGRATPKPAEVYVCGLNSNGQLGVPLAVAADGEETPLNIPYMQRSQEFSGSPLLTADRWLTFAGVDHVVALKESGAVYTIGRNHDHRLGLGVDSAREMRLHRVQMPAEAGRPIGATSRAGSSAVWTDAGTGWAWGSDTTGQLGVGRGDNAAVDRPTKITSKHLDGLKIVQVAEGPSVISRMHYRSHKPTSTR